MNFMVELACREQVNYSDSLRLHSDKLGVI